jgi:hypothetical protein
MTNLTRRIEQLEDAAGSHDVPAFVVVLDHPDEPSEVAIARFRRQYPETPDEARFVLFVSGFTAQSQPTVGACRRAATMD